MYPPNTPGNSPLTALVAYLALLGLFTVFALGIAAGVIIILYF